MFIFKENRERIPAGNRSTGILKLIALVFMIIDHCGVVLFPGIRELRYIGRIAFPLYCWCMVVGFHYSRNVPRYLLRILLTGLLVQPLYSIVLEHGWSSPRLDLVWAEVQNLAVQSGSVRQFLWDLLLKVMQKPNIFLTLFLGLCALWGIREKKAGSQIWAPLLMMMAANITGADYGWKGILLIILLYAVRDSRPGIAAVSVAFFMYWGTFYSLNTTIFGLTIPFEEMPKWLSQMLTPFFRTETYGLLALPLILIPFKREWKMPKWLGYSLYPLHLVLLLVLEQFLL